MIQDKEKDFRCLMDTAVVDWDEVEILRDSYRKIDCQIRPSLFNIDRLIKEKNHRYVLKAKHFDYQVYLFFSRIKSKNYQVRLTTYTRGPT